MLKKIPKIIPPKLMKIMMEMGHGDELLICDGNYFKGGSPDRCVRMDGHGVSALLDAILEFFPLDSYVENPVFFMEVVPGDPYKPEILEEYRAIGKKHEKEGLRETSLERFAFYERGRNCYACIATGESALYANIILKKGVIK